MDADRTPSLLQRCWVVDGKQGKPSVVSVTLSTESTLGPFKNMLLIDWLPIKVAYGGTSAALADTSVTRYVGEFSEADGIPGCATAAFQDNRWLRRLARSLCEMV